MNEQKILCTICFQHILPHDKTEPFAKGLAHKDCYWGQDGVPQEDPTDQKSDLISVYSSPDNKNIVD